MSSIEWLTYARTLTLPPAPTHIQAGAHRRTGTHGRTSRSTHRYRHTYTHARSHACGHARTHARTHTLTPTRTRPHARAHTHMRTRSLEHWVSSETTEVKHRTLRIVLGWGTKKVKLITWPRGICFFYISGRILILKMINSSSQIHCPTLVQIFAYKNAAPPWRDLTHGINIVCEPTVNGILSYV